MACNWKHFAREELVLMTLFGTHAYVWLENDPTPFSKKKKSRTCRLNFVSKLTHLALHH